MSLQGKKQLSVLLNNYDRVCGFGSALCSGAQKNCDSSATLVQDQLSETRLFTRNG